MKKIIFLLIVASIWAGWKYVYTPYQMKKAVEKHLSVHPLDCPVCDADGHCELQDTAFEHGVTNLANAKQKNIPEDTRSLVLDFNMNRCIACGECINICPSRNPCTWHSLSNCLKFRRVSLKAFPVMTCALRVLATS